MYRMGARLSQKSLITKEGLLSGPSEECLQVRKIWTVSAREMVGGIFAELTKAGGLLFGCLRGYISLLTDCSDLEGQRPKFAMICHYFCDACWSQ